jgi:hypothetical protein
VLPARTLVLYWHEDRLEQTALDALRDAVREASDRLAASLVTG